jgi:hypothetical protein
MKALLYARVSKENQGSFSIETQLQKCRKKANELGVADIETYVDNGFSAGDDRPGFNKMVQDYIEGDVIIALSQDRLFHSFKQLMNFRKQNKVQLVLTDDSALKLTEDIVNSFAVIEQNNAFEAIKQSNEVRQKFLAHVAGLVDFWDNEPGSNKEKLKGLAVSILSALDGSAEELPRFIFAPYFDKDDSPENEFNIAGSLHEQIKNYLKD